MELISFDNLTPEERTKAKNKEAARIVLAKTEQHAKQEEKIEIAKKLIKRKLTNKEIAEDTGLTVEQIEALRREKD
jgi:predicted transposase/invertase (TIGR01784 family)